MRFYPVFLDLRGQRCLVVGEGELAAEKASGLRQAGAEVIEVPGAEYRRSDLRGARLVFDASGSREVNAAVWADAEASGVLVNVVDKPDQCRFISPAVVNRDPLLVAISTSGESPYLAAALRARLERQLGHEWGAFVARVGEVRRRLRARGVPLSDQTRVYQLLVRSPLRRLLREGRNAEADALGATIESQAGLHAKGRVALVGAGPGDPSLLTWAAVEHLAEADVVFHDALVSPAVLALCGPKARLVDVGKRAGGSGPAQGDILRDLIRAAHEGNEVVRLKGGDPFVFGRGGEEVEGLVGAGIDVSVVPGISSALATPAAARIPLTLRGVSSAFAVTTGEPESAGRVARIAEAVDTVVVLMGLARLPRLVAELRPKLGDDWPVAVVAGASTAHEKIVRARLGDVVAATSAAGLGAPATIILGKVVEAAAARPAAASGSPP